MKKGRVASRHPALFVAILSVSGSLSKSKPAFFDTDTISIRMIFSSYFVSAGFPSLSAFSSSYSLMDCSTA